MPQKIEEAVSSINSRIKVVSFLGRPRLISGGMLQSGGILESIWKKGINKLAKGQFDKRANCLILGLGGGTLANLINQTFPKAKITAVEIDPVMIKLGRRYFGLDKIPDLEIICADAIEMVISNPRGLTKSSSEVEELVEYDLIFVDLYLGDQFPREAETTEFLENIKKLLKNKGWVVFNRLFYGEHKEKAEKFIHRLEKYFSKIELIRTWSNLLIFSRY